MGGGNRRVARSRVPTAAAADGCLRQVRRAYRRYFRAGASARLANFIYRRLVSRAGGGRGGTAPSSPPSLGLDRGPS